MVLYGKGYLGNTGCLRLYFSPNPNTSSTAVAFSQLGRRGMSYLSGQSVASGAVPFEAGHLVYIKGARSSLDISAQRILTAGDGTEAWI